MIMLGDNDGDDAGDGDRRGESEENLVMVIRW